MYDTITITYLSFNIGEEIFGVDVIHILEVLKGGPVMHITQGRTCVTGIKNFRGKSIAVIDLSGKFNIDQKESAENEAVVVVEILHKKQKVQFGILVENIRRVFSLRENEQVSTLGNDKSLNTKFLSGVTKTHDGVIKLIDVEKILNHYDLKAIVNINTASDIGDFLISNHLVNI